MANEYLVNSDDLTAVADAIRAKGGTSDALAFPGGFVDAVGAIEAGTGGGSSGGGVFGNATPVPNFGNMFYALTSGAAKTGSFIVTNMSTTESPLIDTGLSKINGICFYNAEITAFAGNNRTVFAFSLFDSDGNKPGGFHYTEKNTVNVDLFGDSAGSWSISGGVLNVAVLSWAAGNKNFWPVVPDKEHKWIAW